ncbi:MAG: thiamine pyrophosphate-binding protein [Ectothiorhodospiraceae bacterium]|nr:thiamine pyrophosphate-binding protein [Chromatiales bacterium]MCP5156406.1 thiamine pyrophosphate-binding protein [Ectothiorhodospiraceae bacterium]
MTSIPRGADLLARALRAAGVERLYSLSGNQIMPLYDACIDAGLGIVHVRHEAAAAHMADAAGRLTGRPGIALVTAGPGHANTMGALYTARMSESPMVLLSGHAQLARFGQGAFQEMHQAALAGHVTKAAWVADDPNRLGEDIARALAIASSGRPGPVHLSLPQDVLEGVVDPAVEVRPGARPSPAELAVETAGAVVDHLLASARPLLVTGPAGGRGALAAEIAGFADALGIPWLSMEAPRGLADPTLGAFPEVLARADTIVLLGKALDFALRFGDAPAVDAAARVIHIDPDDEILARSQAALEDVGRLLVRARADMMPAARALTAAAAGRRHAATAWRDEVTAALAYRPASWATTTSAPEGPVHALDVYRAVQAVIDAHDEVVLLVDGGEFGQWGLGSLKAKVRLGNGPAGTIGGMIPMAVAAKAEYPNALVVAVMGDGTFGFQPAEFETAVRSRTPFLCIVGNDARWNAEYQIQLRDYGPNRVMGCELLPARYDQVVAGFGGHGELVTRPSELAGALERSLASGLPACVNVMIDPVPAPVIARTGNLDVH